MDQTLVSEQPLETDDSTPVGFIANTGIVFPTTGINAGSRILDVDVNVTAVHLPDGNITLVLTNSPEEEAFPNVYIPVPAGTSAKVTSTKDGKIAYLAIGTISGSREDQQSTYTAVGKVLRFPAKSDQSLFAGTDVPAELYAVGVRDPSGLTLIPGTDIPIMMESTGKVYIVENGSNFGWNIKSGIIDTTPVTNASLPNLFPTPQYICPGNSGVGGCVVQDTTSKEYYYYCGQQGNIVNVILMSGYRNWKSVVDFRVKGLSEISGVTIQQNKLYVYGISQDGFSARAYLIQVSK
jgi:hypothetical protein